MRGHLWRFAQFGFMGILVLAGGLSAIHFTSLLERGAEGLTRYVRVDVWAIQQTEYELDRFRAVFAQHVAGDPQVTMAEVRKQFATVSSTVPLLKRGEQYEQFRLLVDIDGVAARVGATLAETGPLLAKPVRYRGDLTTLRDIESRLVGPARELRQLAIDMAHIRLELQDGDLANMRWMVGINRWMTIGFVAVALVFIVFLVREIRMARIAERVAKDNEVRARYVAEHDLLTELPNRLHFHEQLDGILDRTDPDAGEVAVHVLDLDDFKYVNDSFGHAFGDKLLVTVAERLRSVLAPQDILARLGGDEFGVIQFNVAAPVDWQATSQRLLTSMDTPFICHGRQVHIGTSIGVARYPVDGTGSGALLQASDLALYAAKVNRGSVAPFESAMMDQLQKRVELEDALRKAILADQIMVYYQPQTNLADGRCIGAEALVRWQHETLGFVSPGVFIPLAEETGLILLLGRKVLERACRDAMTWQGDAENAVVAVNVSPQQFIYEDIVAEVKKVLELTGLPPERLELEITEGMLMREEQTAIETLNRLRGLGVQLAIDDFGTGYSSLSYLKRFNVQKLKVDQCFVREVESDQDDQMIVNAVVQLGHGLGMVVIAEGIETEEQMDLIAGLGCDEGQGYFFSKPIPAAEFQARSRDGALAYLRPAQPDEPATAAKVSTG